MMFTKKNRIRGLSLLLCAAVLGGSAGVAVSAIHADQAMDPADKNVLSDLLKKDGEEDVKAPEKSETVYVIAGADGTVKKLIVSDHLKNVLNDQTLNDKSDLSGIENVKGDEGYTNRDGVLVWDAAGKDIYYQGNIDKEVPVGMKITYTLDGKETDAASLVGKSGKLSMRITYENRQYETVEIDGEKQKIYVPFAMLTGMLLENEIFSNVEVSNGKVVSDGDRTVVIGLALPGLGENLGLDADVVEIPSYVEISADVTNFEMTNTVTVATNELFNKLDLSGFDKIDQLESKLQELNDGVQQLVSGSSELYDGIATLLEKSDELVAGINQLAEGAQKLKDGSGKLTAGAGELKNGAGELADGLHTLVGHNDELNSGAKKVYETLLLTAQTQLEAAGLALPQDLTIENYNTVLSAVKEALSESNVRKQAQAVALEKITEKVEAARPTITAAVTAEVRKNVEAQVTAAVREQVLAAVLETQGMTLDDYRKGVEAGVISEEQQKAITAAVDAQMASDGVKAKITAATDLQMQTAEVQALISENTDAQVKQLIESNMQSDEVKAQIEEAVAKAKAGVRSIDQLIAGLDEYDEFYKGIADYTDGAKDASDGADALKQGASDLYDGSVTLDAGIRELLTGILKMKDGAPALTDGIGKLKDGSMQLRDGLQILDEQGMQKLTAAVNGDLKELVARVRATVEVSKDYTAFSGISDEMKGSVRFIIRTDAIK